MGRIDVRKQTVISSRGNPGRFPGEMPPLPSLDE